MVRVASEIFQHMTHTFERRLAVDNPFFSIQGAEMRLKCRLRLEIFAVPIQNQFILCKIQIVKEFAAKFSAESLYWQEKAVSGFAPFSVRRPFSHSISDNVQ